MNFTTTAPDRKTLVKAIAEHFELDPAYNGPPTFSYSVGCMTVDREGTLIIEDEKTAARLQAFLIEKGWLEAAPEAPAKPDLEEPILNIGFPLTSMTVLSLTNLVHMLYSKQYILAKSVREQRILLKLVGVILALLPGYFKWVISRILQLVFGRYRQITLLCILYTI